MSLKVGQTLSRYRILNKVGAGGMGEVYLAEDTELRRNIALKVLSRKMATDEDGLARFKREAQAVAALNHPNIVTIHSVEEADGIHFITMELVEGETLSHLIRRNGMPLARIFEIAIPVFDAVSTAHRQGITHRDLKPSNIMVSKEGRVKVLDFGLAKLMTDHTSPELSREMTEPITSPGHIVGTVVYMSPEQAEGKPVDPRSDIFSLGIVLYEMATGSRPFQGDTHASQISSLLRDTPPLVTEHNRDLPRHFGRVLNRCLAKNPEERYQSAADVGIELKELKAERDSGVSATQPALAASPKRSRFVPAIVIVLLALVVAAGGYYVFDRFSVPAVPVPPAPTEPDAVAGSVRDEAFIVAVAPFWGATEEAEDEGRVMQTLVEREVYEVLGTEKDVAILGKEIVDIPRTHDEATALGERLGATAVIWGEVLVLRGEVDIQPYITMTKTVTEPEDESADALEIRLDEPDQLSVRKAKAEELGDLALLVAGSFYRKEDPEKALAFLQKIRPPSRESVRAQGRIYQDFQKWDDAERLYRRAMEIDPAWAKPHSDLAGIHIHRNDDEAAIREYEAAIALSPDWSDPYASLGRVYRLRADFDAAEVAYLKAAELGPDHSWPHHELGHLYDAMGDFDKAEAKFKKAIALGPESVNNRICFGKFYQTQQRHDESLAMFAEALKIDSSSTWALRELGRAYMDEENYAAAAAVWEKEAVLRPESATSAARLGEVYAGLERDEEAIAAYKRASELSPDNAEIQFLYAVACDRSGRFDEAQATFEQAIALDSSDLWNHIYYAISLGRLDQQDAARRHMKQQANAIEGDTWIAPVVRFYAGETNEEPVWEAAKDSVPLSENEKKCEAFFYLGMSHLLGIGSPADTAKATAYLEECVATRVTTYIEYYSARKELARLERLRADRGHGDG